MTKQFKKLTAQAALRLSVGCNIALFTTQSQTKNRLARSDERRSVALAHGLPVAQPALHGTVLYKVIHPSINKQNHKKGRIYPS